jgi:hypothetical protein
MPAPVAIRFNPQLKEKYEALRCAGKLPKVAIVAIMRRIVIIVSALIRDNRKWNEPLLHVERPLSAGRFHNEDPAFAYVEAALWPNGPVCRQLCT